MKIAVISDIHGNPHALRDVLKDIQKNECDKVVCCGDIVGYGYDPQKCIDIIRERNIPCVMGNHDAGLVGELSIDWFSETAKRQVLLHRSMVSEESKDWIRKLPYTIVEEIEGVKIAFAHGGYFQPKEFDYIEDSWVARTELDVICRQNILALFVGHTHIACGFSIKSTDQYCPEYIRVSSEKKKYSIADSGNINAIFNAGSVGYPRAQPMIAYCIFDTNDMSVEWRTFRFSHKEYKQRLHEKGMKIPLWVEAGCE